MKLGIAILVLVMIGLSALADYLWKRWIRKQMERRKTRDKGYP